MNDSGIINQLVEDRKLLDSVRVGNDFVLKRLYKDHFPLIKKLVVSNSGDEEDARDIYQEAFIVFYENARMEGFELHASIGTYLYSVARNLWFKRLRTLAQRTEIRMSEDFEVVEVEEDIAESSSREVWVESLGIAMGKIGEPCKTVLEDFFINRLSMDEIAKKMNYTNAANAKNQKYKCFNRLKKLVVIQNRKTTND